MTIQELIEMLGQYDKGLQVVVSVYDSDDGRLEYEQLEIIRKKKCRYYHITTKGMVVEECVIL